MAVSQWRCVLCAAVLALARTAAVAGGDVAHELPTEAILAENQKLAEEKSELAAKIAKASEAADAATAKLQVLRDEEKRVRGLESIAGLTNAIGQLLRKQRLELPDVRRLYLATHLRQGHISDIQAEIFDLEQRKSDTGAMMALPGASDERRTALEHQLQTLDELLADSHTYFRKLVDLDTAESDLAQTAKSYAQFIDQRVLWIRSADVLRRDDLPRAWEAIRWLIDPANWLKVADGLRTDVSSRPPIAAMILLVFGPLLFWQGRMRREIWHLGRLAADRHCVRARPTLFALLLTMTIAAVWPGLLALVGWRLSQTSDAAEFPHALAAGLTTVAIAGFPLACIRQLCRAGGLAEAHFGWPASALQLFRRNLRWFVLLALPMLFVSSMLQEQSVEARGNSLGRMAFITGMILTAICLQRVLRANSPLWKTDVSQPARWLQRLQPFWLAWGILGPWSLAVLAAVGYYYTTCRLVWRLQASLWLLVGLWSLHALLTRWVLLAKRRLAQQQPAEAPAVLIDGHEVETADELSHPDIVQISEQTSRMLHSLVVLGMLAGLMVIWADVLPALEFLNRVQLWTDAESKITFTLANALLALMITIVTWIAVANLPGLLEIIVLQRLPLDAAGRYAINAVSRYLIVLVGLMSAFSAVGIGWAKVQWLLAAVTVGLGFGLQEIFANFISGLIILFERPMRIGDVVTIGGMSGVVSRIRMRATTITDWDRKELIIPNKEFITGRVQNWTLSDQVLRVVVPISLAYDTSIPAVLEQLLAVARRQPHTLTDPPPQAVLVSFANSALNFEVRAYVPSVEFLSRVQHELHTSIHDSLLKAGIAIACEQTNVRMLGPFNASPPANAPGDSAK